MTAPRIRALFIDFGNVCATLQFSRFIDQFARRSRVPGRLVEEVLFNGEEDGGSYSPFFTAFECGEIGPTQFFHQLTTRLDCQDRIDYRTFTTLWASVFDEENEELDRLLQRVAIPKYLLSNTNLAAYAHFIAQSRIVRMHMPLQEQRVLSYRVGSLKPDRAIYDAASEQSGTPFHEGLLVDDRTENLRSWESLGGYSIRYHAGHDHIKQLERDLDRYGIIAR